MSQEISIGLSIAYFFIAFYETDVVAVYLKLVQPRNKWLQEYRASDEQQFIQFLSHKYPHNFFMHLISCPICVAFWIGVMLMPLLGIATFATVFIALSAYFILRKLF